MYLKTVLERMTPFFSEQGFAAEENGGFRAEGKIVRVAFNEAAGMFELYFGESEESEKKIAAYLFDGDRNETDAEAVAIDFVDTLRGQLGIKKTPNRTGEVELPKELNSEKVGMTGFMQKLLAIFPQHKENYKAHVTQYGKLLPVEFCHRYFIPSIRDLLAANNKKSVKKFYDAMADLFVAADAETMPYVVALLASGINGDAALLAAFKEQTADCASLYPAVMNFSHSYQHSNKLKNCL